MKIVVYVSFILIYVARCYNASVFPLLLLSMCNRKKQIMLYLYHVHNFSSHTTTRITRKNYVCENNSNPFLRFIICEISTMLQSDRKGSLEKKDPQIYLNSGYFRRRNILVEKVVSLQSFKNLFHNENANIMYPENNAFIDISNSTTDVSTIFSCTPATISALMSRT